MRRDLIFPLAAAFPLFLKEADAYEPAPKATPVDSPLCNQALHDRYDAEEINKYTGKENVSKVFIGYALDLHNTFFYGGNTIHMVVFDVRSRTDSGPFITSRPGQIRYCILDKHGMVLGIESELRKE